MGLGIRKGDLVVVIKGEGRGKSGRVLAVDSKRGRVRIEKRRMQHRHLKPGRKKLRSGGILQQEGFIDASNVMPVTPEGARSRARVALRDGSRKRVFAKSGDLIPDPVS